MLFNRYTRAFVQAIAPHNYKGITDLDIAAKYIKQARSVTDTFEDNMSDALTMLTSEQQTRLLLQTLENFATLDFLYLENPLYNEEIDFENYLPTENLYLDCLSYSAEQIENRSISEEDAKLLQSRICSGEIGYAQGLVVRSYATKVGNKEANKWILSPSIREYKIAKYEHDLSINQPNQIPLDNTNTIRIPWQYGINDFAEMLYKLERTGAIDLRSYFHAGGKGKDLARAFCNIFNFDPNTNNAVGTLGNYISDIKKGLGRGEYDLGVLKSIGRARGGKMDAVIPKD